VECGVSDQLWDGRGCIYCICWVLPDALVNVW
jgi:hypothetical protein